jgi:hypothetical protein
MVVLHLGIEGGLGQGGHPFVLELLIWQLLANASLAAMHQESCAIVATLT